MSSSLGEKLTVDTLLNNLRSDGLSSVAASQGRDRSPVENCGAKEDSKPMKIAIVGMGCRLPGNVSTPEQFWELCTRARSGWGEIPQSRFNQDVFHHKNPGRSGTHNSKGGHFLQEDVALFDSPFFNITEQEAISLDPQQRLLLETTYEALENGGIPKNSLAGQKVGVFVGGSFSDYDLHNLRDTEQTPMYQATGNAAALLSNRLSYYFDFRGPSCTVDTACSSSLTALHMACQSLRSGDCTQAIVGGCHLNLLPDYFVAMSMQRLFSDEGRSYAFDHRATGGFGRGEGVGCIVLKPLDEAIEANDSIRAVIVATGVNQDGRTKGITMPNGEAQAELMKSIYDSAGLDVNDTGFVEAHGTGTKVGDPIEAKALHEVFGKSRTPKQPLFIGSVKSNIGHLEGASGVVSIIKAAMMLEKGFILPNHNFEKPNENIPMAEWNLKVPTSQRPWPRGKKYVSVNNFGFGGTNAHAVLEKAPPPKLINGPTGSSLSKAITGVWKLFPLSANDKTTVDAMMSSLTVYLEQRPEVFQNALMGNLAYTLGERRSHLSYRIAIPANKTAELIPALASSRIVASRAVRVPRIGFIFTGQGAQWHAMGLELMDAYPIFASAMQEADACLAKFGADFSLVEELQKDAQTSRVSEAQISQPACTAVQLALTSLLASWGIYPTAVAGHSSGEIGAAYAAGVLSLEDCMAIAYYRGQAIISLKKQYPDLAGTMLAVGGSAEDVAPMLKFLTGGKVVVACINSPSSITASGDVQAIAQLQDLVDTEQMFNRRLKVDTAYHSHHMELVAEEYLSNIKHITLSSSPARSLFYSSLLGYQVEGSALSAEYWRDNLTRPVQFSAAVQKMCEAGSDAQIDTLIELGPHAALEGPIKQILKSIAGKAAKIGYSPALIRNQDAVETSLQMAANMFTSGADLNFTAINFPKADGKAPVLLIDTPRYPWNHSTRYWNYSRISENHLHRSGVRNDIVGALAMYSNDLEPTWRNMISIDDMPWLRHHKMQGLCVYPIAGYIAMAIEVAAQRAVTRNVRFDHFELREITASRALVIQDGISIETNITLRPYAEGTRHSSDLWDEFTISSWHRTQGWVEHCRGLVSVQKISENEIDGQRQSSDSRAMLHADIAKIESECSTSVDSHSMYEVLASKGVEYATIYRTLANIRASDNHAAAQISLPDVPSMMPNHFQPDLIIHPAVLDQLIQLVFPIFGAGRTPFETFYMPSFVKSVSISRDMPTQIGTELRFYGSGNPTPANPAPTKFTCFAIEGSGPADKPLITVNDLVMTPVSSGATLQGEGPRELCYKLTYEDLEVKDISLSSSVVDLDISIICDLPQETAVAPEQVNLPSQQAVLSGLVESLVKVTGKTPDIGTLANISSFKDRILIFLTELDQPLLAELNQEQFERLQSALTSAQGVLWAVKGAYTDCSSPHSNMIQGLARTIRSETLLKFATIEFGSTIPINAPELVFEAFQNTFINPTSDSDMEYTVGRGEKLLVPRVVDDSEMNKFVHQETSKDSTPDLQPFSQPGRPLKMAIEVPGALDTLYFKDVPALPLPGHEVEIEVKATSMNFKDIMITMGQLSSTYLGIECAGVITQVGSKVTDLAVGDRVCAMSEGAYSTLTRCLGTSAQKIPDDMSFEVGATIPVIYCTAYYSLVDLANLRKDESVLIHAAAGGVGQAAIILSQMIGAEIFCTVGSLSKKDHLMKEYGIPEDHIFYSRDASFANALRRATNNQGVDVVLNSLAGNALRETWDCLAHFGRFIEIGKRDITTNTRLEMARFEHNAMFASVDLTVVALERPKMMKRILNDVFELLSKKEIRPISPITIFPISEVEQAFRTLQGGKIMGKIVVTAGPQDQVKAVPRTTPNDLLKPDATYIIIGGTGGLGRSMAKWMVGKGAKSIVLVSRNGKATGKVAELIEEASAAGASISVRSCDVSNWDQVENLVTEGVKGLPAVRGIIHSAMVLNDVLYEKMQFSEWESVTSSKVAGARNLHNALLDTKLDFFVTISSAAGAVGNRGQAAYAAANCFLNAFCQYRVKKGLPASSIDLTAVSDVGYLAENAEKATQTAENLGSETISEVEVLALLAASISGRMVKDCNNHCMTGLKIGAQTRDLFWVDDAKFSHLRRAADAKLQEDTTSAPVISLSMALKNAQSHQSALSIVYNSLVAKLSAVLMVPEDEIDASKPVSVYGLDSLVAIEIRNWITREFDASLQVLELLASSSILSLAETILAKSKLVSFKPEDHGVEEELNGDESDGSVSSPQTSSSRSVSGLDTAVTTPAADEFFKHFG